MITDWLEDKGIEHWTEGKNVSKGWIGLQCSYCADESNHLGIELSSGRVSCWLCGPHGKIIDYIMDIENCSYRIAKEIVAKVWEGNPDLAGSPKLPPSVTPATRVVLPPIMSHWPKKYLNYLQGRGYSPQSLISRYRLMAAHRFGHYGFRIIVPFFTSGEMTGYIGADVTGKSELKYKDSPIEESVIPPSQCLYNLDRVTGGKVVIVEGVTDVWRIGAGAAALGTNKINDEQILQLVAKDIKKVLVLLDSDASGRADKVAADIVSTGAIDVDIATLDRDDPDKMDYADLLRVRRWLS